MYSFNIFHETNKTQFDECRETVTRYENIPPGMLATVIDRIIKDPAFNETTDWVQVTVFTDHSEPQQTGYDGRLAREGSSPSKGANR